VVNATLPNLAAIAPVDPAGAAEWLTRWKPGIQAVAPHQHKRQLLKNER
jgi:hypothetical protein